MEILTLSMTPHSASLAQVRFCEILQKFGEAMGVRLEPVDLLPDGQFLVIDGTIELTILLDEENATIQLSAPVGELTGDEDAGFLRMLLDSNLFWAGASGAMVALDNTSGRLFLQDKRPLGQPEPPFQVWVENFVNKVDDWSRTLAADREEIGNVQLTTSPEFENRA